MVTTGGAISGYWAIGRLRIAARPAITMKIESTAANIGRSMKKRENMMELPLFLCDDGSAAFGRPVLRGVGFPRLRFSDSHGRARADLHDAVHDHAIAGGETRSHDPGFAVPVAKLDRPGLGLALGVDDVDELALRTFEHRALRHQDRGRPLGAL